MSLDAYPHQVGGSVSISVTGTDHPSSAPAPTSGPAQAPVQAPKDGAPGAVETKDSDKG